MYSDPVEPLKAGFSMSSTEWNQAFVAMATETVTKDTVACRGERRGKILLFVDAPLNFVSINFRRG